MKKYFIIDFDSTLTRVEALDVMAEISLHADANKEEIKKQIKDLTDMAMSGQMPFRESLEKRLLLLQANKAHVENLVQQLNTQISASFLRNKDFFDRYRDRVYVVSNGFHDYIDPIVESMGVRKENIFANRLTFDEKGNITGFDQANPLSKNNGKVEILKSLKLNGDVYVIGDGYNDYEIKAAGFANKFYAFTENVIRDKVTAKADHVAPSLDEILYMNKLNTAISYPKNRIKVLLLENVHPEAARILAEEGYQVETHKGAMDEKELSERIKDVSILGIRSKTHLTKKVLENANRLIVIGAFCIGTNQIDLEECLKKGIAVFNAPFSNTRSVVELAIGEIIMLQRGIMDKSNDLHAGKWNKSAENSHEIRGKKLGIVGYGNIGAQLSVVSEMLGMKVYYYDLEEKLALGNATKCDSLKQLLNLCDIISLHIDGRAENKLMFGKAEFEEMKAGSIFVNLSRGHVVDLKALKHFIETGKIIGAAIDVFPHEPKTNEESFISELQNLPNTILTPHIGGSTIEAQESIAGFVPGRFIEYINTGSTTNSVNFPNLQLPRLQNAHRLIHIHHNVPGILAKINQILASHQINIVGQYLKTNEHIGYVITDIDKAYNKAVITDMKEIKDTIKFRILY